MNEKQLKRVSKLMSLILRHKPETINAELDVNGWLSIDELVNGINKKGIRLDKIGLKKVVELNDKKRFIISPDELLIRANQGHSIHVDLELKALEPPKILYHGTVEKFLQTIEKEGLSRMNRQHVHLSADRETAVKVGSRRGNPIILVVKAEEMHKDGITFYQSENGVWLTDSVGAKYIEFK